MPEILLIEDNPADVRLLSEAFRVLGPDIRVHVAHDGAEGLAMISGQNANKWRPDLILLDLNLPKVSGHDVLVSIKTNPHTSRIPVLVLTSSRVEADTSMAYEEYANAYLRKPSTLEEVMSIARRIKRFWLDTATLPR